VTDCDDPKHRLYHAIGVQCPCRITLYQIMEWRENQLAPLGQKLTYYVTRPQMSSLISDQASLGQSPMKMCFVGLPNEMTILYTLVGPVIVKVK